MFGLRVVGFLTFCSLCTSVEIRGNSTFQIAGQRLDLLINQIINEHNKDIIQIKSQLESSLNKVKETVNKLENTLASLTYNGKEPFSDSTILNGTYREYFHWFPGNTWSICYRGSSDGWSSKIFHAQCDKKGPTVTLVRSFHGYIFGGFANISWGTINDYTAAPGTFLFSLLNKDNIPPFKSVLGNEKYNRAVLDNHRYGPTFGGGYDMIIDVDRPSGWYSYTDFGYTFQLPAGYSYGAKNTRALLAGRHYFRLSEVEVFYLK